MKPAFSIFCDESCHLPTDGQPIMVLGALVVPAGQAREIAARIGEIKQAAGIPPQAEVKWGKVSPRWLPLYEALVDFFFDTADLRFRAVIADKTSLDHSAFSQTHDEWYYKMYYLLLSRLLSQEEEFRIYLDIKDTQGGPKVRKLEEILRADLRDFSGKTVKRVQTVRSHEVQAIQVADILLGAVSHGNRDGGSSQAKRAIAQRIEARSGARFKFNTAKSEAKFNLFHWQGRAGVNA